MTLRNKIRVAPWRAWFVVALLLMSTCALSQKEVRPTYRVKATSLAPRSSRAARLSPITLQTQHSRPVRFYEDLVRDKTVLINFMYASCKKRCPLTTHNLMKVYDVYGSRMGQDTLILSISVNDPPDTPQALRNYIERNGGERAGWLYLTGDYHEIWELRHSLGAYDLDPVVDADKTQHAGLVTFGNDRNDRWYALPGMLRSNELVEAIARLTR